MEINPIEKLLRIGLQTTGSNEEQAMINEFDFTLIDKDACGELFIFILLLINFHHLLE